MRENYWQGQREEAYEFASYGSTLPPAVARTVSEAGSMERLFHEIGLNFGVEASSPRAVCPAAGHPAARLWLCNPFRATMPALVAGDGNIDMGRRALPYSILHWGVPRLQRERVYTPGPLMQQPFPLRGDLTSR